MKNFVSRSRFCSLAAIVLMLFLEACTERAQPAVLVSQSTDPYAPLPTNLTFTPPLATMDGFANELPLILESPTPLATPSVGYAGYTLRHWGEQDALGLVNVAEEFARSDNIPGMFGGDRFNYVEDQLAVRLAARDALHRFPDTNYREELEWRIALADAILGNSDSNPWVLQHIADGLNRGQFTMDELSVVLNRRGFGIYASDMIPNLLGVGHPGQVLVLFLPGGNFTGLYAALEKDSRGRYHLVPIHSDWAFNRAADLPLQGADQPRDHTGDGIPEIIIFNSYFNGSYTGDNTIIYQWETDHFADISRGQFYLDATGAAPAGWQFGEADSNGTQPILVNKGVAYTSSLVVTERYDWDGKGYRLSETRVQVPDVINDVTSEWPSLEMGIGAYGPLISELPVFLSTPSKMDVSNLGPSYPDYLQFQLAQAYVLSGDLSKGRTSLLNIVHHPRNPQNRVVPQAARAYTDQIRTRSDAYRACQAALNVMSTAAAGHLYGLEQADTDFMFQAWGYGNIGGYYKSNAVCSLRDAFALLAGYLEPARFSGAPQALRGYGVAIRSATQADFDGDSQPEWILLVDTPEDDAPIDLWILKATPEKVIALPVVDWVRKQYDLPVKDTDSLALEIATARAPDGNIVSFAKLGAQLFMFQLEVGGEINQISDSQFTNHLQIKNYSFDSSGEQLQIKVWPTYCDDCNETFGWSTLDGRLVPDPAGDADRALRQDAEQALLTSWQPDEALPLLQKIQGNPDEYRAAYFMYLLGLAYEIRGDEGNAVRTYWNLWQSHPESAYARLVLARLEVKK